MTECLAIVITQKTQVKSELLLMNNAKHDNLEPGLGTRNFEMILKISKFQNKIRLQSGSKIRKTSLFFDHLRTSCFVHYCNHGSYHRLCNLNKENYFESHISTNL